MAPSAAHLTASACPSTQNPDGTWTIKGVPVFASHTDWRTGRKFDRAWLEAAVAKNQARYTVDAYRAPLHVRHHLPGQDVQGAGKFQLTCVAELPYEGKPTAFVLADLTVSPEVYASIRSGKLSYVSVEIHRPNGGPGVEPEIDSLALLDHDVPYFRKELRVAEAPAPTTFRLGAEARPVLCYSAIGAHESVLFRFTEAPPMSVDNVPAGTLMTADGAPAAAPAPPAAPTGDGLLQAIFQALQALSAKIDGLSGAAPEAEGAAPALVMSAAPNGLRVLGAPLGDTLHTASASAATNAASVSGIAEAALLGRVVALEGHYAATRKAEENRTAVDKTLSELRAYGVGEETRPVLMGIATKAGLPGLAAFAEGLKAGGLREPPTAWAGELPASEGVANGRGLGNDTPAVAAYQALGPKHLAEARRLDREHFRAKGEHASAAWLASQDETGPLDGRNPYAAIAANKGH